MTNLIIYYFEQTACQEHGYIIEGPGKYEHLYLIGQFIQFSQQIMARDLQKLNDGS